MVGIKRNYGLSLWILILLLLVAPLTACGLQAEVSPDFQETEETGEEVGARQQLRVSRRTGLL